MFSVTTTISFTPFSIASKTASFERSFGGTETMEPSTWPSFSTMSRTQS